MTDLNLIHVHRPATAPDAPALLLLHGTGADEYDLLPLGQTLAPGGALVSPRGPVNENGRPRFFRRLAEGIFDEADVTARAGQLAQFTRAAQAAYTLPKPIAVGFSNGANIAAATLFQHPDAFAGAILLRAMPPLKAPPAANLNGLPVLLLSGTHDPIATEHHQTDLENQFKAAGANLTHHRLPAGHALTNQDLALAQAWLQNR